MTDLNKCETCPIHNVDNLVKLGIKMDGFDYVIALMGNPNTGKSTVFNNLTGLRQHTGNWPGKTVTRAEGAFSYSDTKYKVVDLPGTYSLLSTSTDEEVARDFILFGQPDVTVIVVDATRLERNLNLVLQVLEITDRTVVCLNLMDEAKRHGIEIDDRALSRELGVPVIPTAARQKEGMNNLLKSIHEVAEGKYICKPYRIKNISKKVSKAVEGITERVQEEFPELPNARWVAMRLLEGDQSIIEALKTGDLGKIRKAETEIENVA
ncbi:MAG: FeoB small GTPase domain-containing protein [Melioribacteraceae bacterium]|nr:FeoB small GTPase domain-containing protein [Melioribacteraceae bacterium]